MKCQKHEREIVAAARRELSPIGGTVDLEHGGHRPKLVITIGDETRQISFPGSPRCADLSITKATADVRRLVRGMEAGQ